MGVIGQVIEALVGAGKLIGKSIAEAREAVAADLERLAKSVRDGELVDDAMLARAVADHDAIKAARNKRPN